MDIINDDNIISKINEAGETIFKNIYKSMQSEIKDEIITKLLRKIEVITKELESLRSENKNLKNHLTYILKRILLNKSYYDKISNNEPQSNFLGYKTKTCNNIFKQTKDNEHLSISSTKKNVLNRSFSKENKLNNNNNNHRTKSIDIKVNGKLNSIYKNNFLRCSKGITNDFILNKNESIYDELFPIYKKLNYNTSRNSMNREKNKVKEETNDKKNFNYSYMTNNKINKMSCLTCKLNKIINCRTHNNSKSRIINAKKKNKFIKKKGDNKFSSTINIDPLDYYKTNSALTVGNDDYIKFNQNLLRSENLIPIKKKPKKIFISNTKSPFLINKI